MLPSSCREVHAAIRDQGCADRFGRLDAGGVMDLDDFWTSSRAAEKHYKRLKRSAQRRVYVAPAWNAKAYEGDEAKTWKILVSNKEFFRPGARYCLFIITQAPKRLDAAEIEEILTNYGKRMTGSG